MVLPVVAYGAWALGGLIVGACVKAGIDKISDSDHKVLENMNKKYEQIKKQAEIDSLNAKNQADLADKHLAVLKKQIELAKQFVELQKLVDQVTDDFLKKELREKMTLNFITNK